VKASFVIKTFILELQLQRDVSRWPPWQPGTTAAKRFFKMATMAAILKIGQLRLSHGHNFKPK